MHETTSRRAILHSAYTFSAPVMEWLTMLECRGGLTVTCCEGFHASRCSSTTICRMPLPSCKIKVSTTGSVYLFGEQWNGTSL